MKASSYTYCYSCIAFSISLITYFWGGCVLTIAYLINRRPSPLLSNKSPFELLYKHPPSFDHIRLFGCLCYATIVHPLNKFDASAQRCIFIGCRIGQKGYKLYDIDNKKFFVSREHLITVLTLCKNGLTLNHPPQTTNPLQH